MEAKIKELEQRHERFIKDIAFIFLYNVLAIIFIIGAFTAQSIILFTIFMVMSAVFAGIGISIKIIMLHKILTGAKWIKK